MSEVPLYPSLMDKVMVKARRWNGARPVHLIITMIQWIRTSRLSINNSLSLDGGGEGLLLEE